MEIHMVSGNSMDDPPSYGPWSQHVSPISASMVSGGSTEHDINMTPSCSGIMGPDMSLGSKQCMLCTSGGWKGHSYKPGPWWPQGPRTSPWFQAVAARPMDIEIGFSGNVADRQQHSPWLLCICSISTSYFCQYLGMILIVKNLMIIS